MDVKQQFEKIVPQQRIHYSNELYQRNKHLVIHTIVIKQQPYQFCSIVGIANHTQITQSPLAPPPPPACLHRPRPRPTSNSASLLPPPAPVPSNHCGSHIRVASTVRSCVACTWGRCTSGAPPPARGRTTRRGTSKQRPHRRGYILVGGESQRRFILMFAFK